MKAKYEYMWKNPIDYTRRRNNEQGITGVRGTAARKADREGVALENRLRPGFRETHLVDDKVTDPLNVDETFADQVAPDIVTRELHAEVLYDSERLARDLRADNRATEGEKDDEEGQQADFVQRCKIVFGHTVPQGRDTSTHLELFQLQQEGEVEPCAHSDQDDRNQGVVDQPNKEKHVLGELQLGRLTLHRELHDGLRCCSLCRRCAHHYLLKVGIKQFL